MKPCETCGKEILKNRFCNKSCAGVWSGKNRDDTKSKICIFCDKKRLSYRHIRCKDHQEEYAKLIKNKQNESIKNFIEKDSIKGKPKSWKFAHIRALARCQHANLLEKPCHNCGFDQHVELCHIKPISQFDENSLLKDVNHIENVIQLCRNCHWEFDNGLIELKR